MITLSDNRYGKSRVRLVQVKRHPDRHDFREWAVQVLLEGDFEACFVAGDNSKILPTDTMKNTVYSLARKSSAGCIEEFAKELLDFLLVRNPQVSAGQVTIAAKTWEHLATAGEPHPTTFVQSSAELQTADVALKRNAAASVSSGVDNLLILKTAGSEFVGFIRDSLTTLPEATDRLFGTNLRARWTYKSPNSSFAALRPKVRESLLSVFANHVSKSVQHTLYAMGEEALKQVPEIEDIELTMPNKHCLLVDLSKFGQENPNEIFVPIDEPHGYIEARLCRRG